MRAGRSVWYDRSVGIAEDAGSNPAPSTKFLSEKNLNLDQEILSVHWDFEPSSSHSSLTPLNIVPLAFSLISLSLVH